MKKIFFLTVIAVAYMGVSLANAADMIISGDSRFGCTTKDYYGKLTGYAVQGDNEAFQKGFAAGLLTGNCIILKAGQTVFVADTAIFSGLVKVRQQGSVAEFWTTMEAVKEGSGKNVVTAKVDSGSNTPRAKKRPPAEKGENIIGTWYDNVLEETMSIEQVGSKYYEVKWFKDGSGGGHNVELTRVNSTTFFPTIPRHASGDHCVIQSTGDLELRDNQGLIETLPKAIEESTLAAKNSVELKSSKGFHSNADGTVTDFQTGLMWAAKDNGADINWPKAKAYCQNYRVGGYTDWRLPTQDELDRLYDKEEREVHTPLIEMSAYQWSSETHGSEAAYYVFLFGAGGRYWGPQSDSASTRALPVRGGVNERPDRTK